EIVMLVDGWPVVLVIGMALLFVILLGEFASNTATAALMVPIFFSVAGELDLAPAKLVIPMALAASCGFMLPVATPPNAMVFATGRIRQNDMLRAGLALDLVSLVAVTLLAWWFF
ncbi:MAG: SLC13 family permease, partial [Akkermansiaceae bacterium]|nr:SLC13 family permease [Akkermansiaceae bacterium]